MSLVVSWIRQGTLSPQQSQSVLEGFFRLVQWTGLDQSSQDKCNLEFRKSMHKLKYSSYPEADMLGMASEWIQQYLDLHPNHDERVSGFVIARSYD